MQTLVDQGTHFVFDSLHSTHNHHNSHGDILCGLSGDIPIFDEICMRSMRFIAACLQHGSRLIRFLVQYGIYTGISSKSAIF